MQNVAIILEIERLGADLIGEQLGNGPPILLLHAGGETRAVWRPVMQILSGRGFSSVAYDQRGHGVSAGSPADGILSYGEDAKAMIRRLSRPVVVGGSLGGFALMLALEELEHQVSGLVLVDVTPAPDPELTRAYLGPRGHLGTSPLIDDILSRSDHLTRIVEGLKLPVLLVCGGARSPLGEDARRHFNQICPQAEITIIEHASHLLARDAPTELARFVADFARRVISPNSM